MARMMAKAKRKKFVNDVRDYLLSIGAVMTKNNPNDEHNIHDGLPDYEFTYNSKYGELRLHVLPRTSGQAGPGDVMTRFHFAKMANPHTGCNPFSGKWNHHYFDGYSEKSALDAFKASMERVAPTPLDDFMDETAIVPRAVAETVVGERGVMLVDPLYAGENGLNHEQAKAWFIEHVERRTVMLWDNNKRFRKILESDGDNGRDTLYAFVEHWLDAYLDSPLDYRKEHGGRTSQAAAA